MKRILASLVVLSMSLPGSVGCSDLTSTKSETNASTPDRSATVITEKEARTTGDTNVIIGTPNDQPNRPSADRQQGGSCWNSARAGYAPTGLLSAFEETHRV